MPRTQRQIVTIALAALVVAGAVTGGLVWHHKASPKHWLTVTPDVLYRSGLLRTHNLEYVIDRYGIKTVVNLIDPGSKNDAQLQEERRVTSEMGVRFVDLPMEPETPPSEAQMNEWLALLDDPENHPVLVHCKHGVIRTGMMVAMYEIEYLGRANQEAMAGTPDFGHDLYKPSREPMRDFILNYTPRSERQGLGGD